MRATIAVTLLLLTSTLAADEEGFRPPRLTSDNLYREFEDAILHLKTTTDRSIGTGYLIDSAHGYVLTASHVIHDAGTLELYATRKSTPNARHKLILRKDLCTGGVLPCSTMDLALLQLADEGALRDTRPVDIALNTVSGGTLVYIMGYPVITEDASVNLSQRDAKLTGWSDTPQRKRHYQVDVGAFQGDSGSPVFDEYGRVIATVVARPSAAIAIAEPLAKSVSMLLELPITPRVKHLDERLRHLPPEATFRDDLIRSLVVRTTSCTNIELLLWANIIGQNPGTYQSVITPYLDYPFIRALQDRDIKDAEKLLGTVGPPAAVGRAFYHVGQRAQELGDQQEALTNLRKATAYLKTALASRAERRPQGFAYALCRANPTSADGAVALNVGSASFPTAIDCDNATTDLGTYALTKDYALSLHALGAVAGTDSPEGQQAYADAIAAARLTTWAAAPAQRSVAYTDFAKILLDAGQPKDAAAAYATANRLGANVLDLWKGAAEKAVDAGEAPRFLLSTPIGEAPYLKLQALAANVTVEKPKSDIRF